MSESPSTLVADSKGDGGSKTMATIITGGAQQFTAQQRCDRCGGQAYMQVFTRGGGEVLFCAHHGTEHWDALKVQAETIIDQRGRLTAMENAPRDAGSTI